MMKPTATPAAKVMIFMACTVRASGRTRQGRTRATRAPNSEDEGASRAAARQNRDMTAAEALLARFVRTVDQEGLAVYGAHALVADEEAQHRWRSDDRVNLYSVSKGV